MPEPGCEMRWGLFLEQVGTLAGIRTGRRMSFPVTYGRPCAKGGKNPHLENYGSENFFVPLTILRF